MRFLIALFFVLFLGIGTVMAQSRTNMCQLQGKVFEEKSRAYATYRVFVENDEGLADLVVFKENSAVYADKPGKWFFVKTRNFADFTIYVEESRSLADFTISYTEYESFAGCR